MKEWWNSFDKGDRAMFLNIGVGAGSTLFVWWLMFGRKKYGGSGVR